MEYILFVLLYTGAAFIFFFTTYSCYHYIRNLNIANDNEQDYNYIINEVFNTDNFNSTKTVHFNC